MIYLDTNATTTIDPRVVQTMASDWASGPANASSQHGLGRKAKARFEDALDLILDRLGTREHRLIVTSGGTEANNWVVNCLGEGDGPLIVSNVEHPSVLLAAQALERRGKPVRYLSVSVQGVVDLDLLRSWLAETPTPRAVSVMLANNETGVVQPAAEIARSCIDAGVPFHCDASAIGKLPFDMDQFPMDAVTLSPHKFHGPIGVGGLLLKRGSPISHHLFGGAQQLEYRPGTEPIALTQGFAAAVDLCLSDLDQRIAGMRSRQRRLESELKKALSDLIIHGDLATRLPQTTCFSLPNVDRQALLMGLDFAGIACSSGSACASGSSEPSHVLQAMGLPDDLVNGAIRISGSAFDKEADIDTAALRIISCCNKLRAN